LKIKLLLKKIVKKTAKINDFLLMMLNDQN